MARYFPTRRRVSKEHLVAIAEKLMSSEPLSAAEVNRLIDEFDANTSPQSSELILRWAERFNSAAEIVDFVLGELKMKKITRGELIDITN